MIREREGGIPFTRDTDKNITTILANESVRSLCRKLSCYLLLIFPISTMISTMILRFSPLFKESLSLSLSANRNLFLISFLN